MAYYVPLYGSEPLSLRGISESFEIIGWIDVPKIIRNRLTNNDYRIPESVAVTNNPEGPFLSELSVLSLIFEKPYDFHQWANEDTVHTFSTSYSISLDNPSRLIKD